MTTKSPSKQTATQLISQSSNKPIVFMGTLGLQAINTLFLLLVTIGLFCIAFKPAPNLVELTDGKAVQVTAQDHLKRNNETIHRFISDFINLMFSWTGTLPPDSIEAAKAPLPDPGVALNRTKDNTKIATSAYQAAFALSEDFRKPFLESVADITPQELFAVNRTNGIFPTQVLPIIKYISDPIPSKPGVWTVNIIANLAIFNDQNKLGKVIPFNKEISLRAVIPPLKPGESQLEKEIFNIRKAGLEIFAIRDYEQ